MAILSEMLRSMSRDNPTSVAARSKVLRLTDRRGEVLVSCRGALRGEGLVMWFEHRQVDVFK